MGFMFLFFSTLKSDEHYAEMPLGPTPSVGHVTGDMKRRESNETLWRWEVGSILSYRIELSSRNVPSLVTESSSVKGASVSVGTITVSQPYLRQNFFREPVPSLKGLNTSKR